MFKTLNNKMFFVFLLSFVCIISLNSFVFASTIDDVVSACDSFAESTNNLKRYVITADYEAFFYPREPVVQNYTNNEDGSLACCLYCYDSVYRYIWDSENNCLTDKRRINTITVDYTNIIYSNFDLKDSDGNVVFQNPPPLIQLARVVEESNPAKVLEEILGILPMVMITIVGFLGLRKGLAILHRVLHQV